MDTQSLVRTTEQNWPAFISHLPEKKEPPLLTVSYSETSDLPTNSWAMARPSPEGSAQTPGCALSPAPWLPLTTVLRSQWGKQAGAVWRPKEAGAAGGALGTAPSPSADGSP